MRVGVLVPLGAKQPSRFAERLDDLVVVLEHHLALEVRHALVVGPVRPNRVLKRHPVSLAELEVVLAEGERGVDESRALLGADEVGQQHRVAEWAELLALDEIERGLVANALERGAREMRQHLGILAEHPLDQRPGNDHRLLTKPRADVLDLRTGGNRGMTDQRPGGRRPDEQVVPGLDRVLGNLVGGRHVGDRQAHVDRWVDDVLIALRDLVRGERGAVAGAVGDHLVRLVETTAVPDLAQRPPHRFDVFVGERDVGVVEVDPEADPLREPVPLLDVAEHRLAAASVELGDPVVLDLGLRGDPELLFDLELDREPVAVPARLARHVVPPHRLIARVDVLERAREHVMRPGLAVRGRRALVEAPDRRAGVSPLGELAGEDVALAPALEHLELQLREGLLRVDRLESAHERRILGARAWRPGPALTRRPGCRRDPAG